MSNSYSTLRFGFKVVFGLLFFMSMYVINFMLGRGYRVSLYVVISFDLFR